MTRSRTNWASTAAGPRSFPNRSTPAAAPLTRTPALQDVHGVLTAVLLVPVVGVLPAAANTRVGHCQPVELVGLEDPTSGSDSTG
ncbi:hypothetical protein ACWGRV_07840 [Streptomyces sp. NPDC055663]